MGDRVRGRDAGAEPVPGERVGSDDFARQTLAVSLDTYRPLDAVEARDLQRVIELLGNVVNPWARSEPLHLTASALVVHVPSHRVLLRWHERHGRYMQVGGHGDEGEDDPLAVALREAAEETGLSDLRPLRAKGASPRVAWGSSEVVAPAPALAAVGLAPRPTGEDGELVQVVVVPVPARADEAAHEHADLRYVFQTDAPDDAYPEDELAHLRWVSWDEAFDLVAEPNLHVLLERARLLLG